MLAWLKGIVKDADGQINWSRVGAVLSAVVIAAWAVFKFVVDHKAAHDQGPSKEQIEQIQKPLAEQLAAQNALIKMLLEKNPAAAGPGAQQAVGTAVASIAQGAEAGDSRLEQALGLLNENKIAEATKLLTAFAGDKAAQAEKATAQAEKDRKEAAVAYRNLGAIAGLADPKGALEAYEKALALDPEDIESLYQTGYLLVGYGDLNKAQKRLEHVQELAKTGDQAFYKYAALGTLGDIKQRRGDLSGALQSYQGTIPIISRLAQSDPGNAGWQRELSVSYNKVGDVLVAQGNLPAALKSYSDSLAIRERLAKSDPGNARWQRDLAVSYDNVGDVQVSQGDLKAALKSRKDAFPIFDNLAKSDVGNADWQRELSVSYNKVGDVLVKQGNLPEALKTFRDGLAIRDRLAKSDPANADWQRDLAVSYDNIGDVQVSQGELKAALKSYKDAFAIVDNLAKSDVGNADWQRDLSVSYDRVGDVLVAQGDLSEALKSYQDSSAIFDRLAKSDPGNAQWQRDLIISYKKIADCSPPKERRANLSRALEIAQALHTSGRLAPADEWMLGALARLIAEVSAK